jgi:uracil phosphoribosyltransferase
VLSFRFVFFGSLHILSLLILHCNDDTTRPCDGCVGPDPTTICAVSIVRSGDALLEVVRDVEPAVRVGKILIQRDESHPDKIAKLFYSKLPPTVGTPATPYVLLCDPMLATGGSALTAIDVLVGDQYKVAPEKIIFANMICAPEGLKIMAEKYPQIKIVTVAIDERLNDDKFIVPGLGEFSAVQYSTVVEASIKTLVLYVH